MRERFSLEFSERLCGFDYKGQNKVYGMIFQ